MHHAYESKNPQVGKVQINNQKDVVEETHLDVKSMINIG